MFEHLLAPKACPIIAFLLALAPLQSPQSKPAEAAPSRSAPDDEQRIAHWREDLKSLSTELAMRHKNAFFRCKVSDFESAVRRLDERIGALDDTAVSLEFARLAAMLGDTHTQVQIDVNALHMHVFPFITRVFADGVFIIAARQDHADLLGSQILAIDGMPMAEVIQRVRTLFAWENESSLKNTVCNWMVLGEALKTVEVAKNSAQVTLSLKTRDGAERAVALDALPPGARVPFTSLPDAKVITLGISWQRRKESYWFEPLSGGKALYVRYDRCSDDAGKSVRQFSEEVLKQIDDHKPERVIIDIRRNSGGNSALLHPLIGGLASRESVNQKDTLFVLIGRTTFSSAMMNAQEFRDRTRATLMGEPTGGKPNHHGEIRTFTLPHSKLLVQYSTKYFRMVKDDPPSVVPDVLAEMTSADYFAGLDVAFDRALAASDKNDESIDGSH